MTRARVRLLHSSDVHLGADHGRLGPAWHGPGCACPLRMLTKAAARQKCDLLLIAGDVFDSNRVRESLVMSALAVLARLKVPCVIVPGNHDALDKTSLYRRYAFEASAPLLRVVRRPEGEVIDFPASGMRVWARPMIDHVPAHRPLAGAPLNDGHGWYVIAAHGHYMETEADELAQVRSSPIFPRDLNQAGADYIALGHWDLPEQVGGPQSAAWYSGAPAIGGLAKTAMLVTMDPQSGVSVEGLALEAEGAAECDGFDLSGTFPVILPE